MVGEWIGSERIARGAVDGDIGSAPCHEDVRRVTLADRLVDARVIERELSVPNEGPSARPL